MAFGPFSLLPNGLPNLFGLTGQAMPKAMEELVQCQLDLLQFVAQANCMETLKAAAINLNAAAGFNIPEMIVPDTEAWLVLGATVSASSLVGEHLRYKLVAARSSAGGPTRFRTGDYATTSLTDANAIGQAVASLNGPFLLYPADAITIIVESIATAGAIQAFAHAAIFRFTV